LSLREKRRWTAPAPSSLTHPIKMMVDQIEKSSVKSRRRKLMRSRR
jgi:hypothetical protein